MRTRNTDKQELVKQQSIELIVKHGFEGFTMNKLSQACDISVATLYIYYKDKDDLIVRIAQEEGERMGKAMLENFDPEMHFEEGLRVQWQNRYKHMTANPVIGPFFDQLRSSTYHETFLESFKANFVQSIEKFMTNACERGEINPMIPEVYWSVAFAPLYSLLRFDTEGQSFGGRPFKISDEVVWKAFDLVIKALKN
jgi:AcrR family transcriptional regulator